LVLTERAIAPPFKGLGKGLYDGLTGFVTQPIQGAQKQGGIGFLKGFGKGVGGLVLKPAAGECLGSGFFFFFLACMHFDYPLPVAHFPSSPSSVPRELAGDRRLTNETPKNKGACGVPGYAFMGVYKQIQKIAKTDVDAQIMAARQAQGGLRLRPLSNGDKSVIVKNWLALNGKSRGTDRAS
jgi:hypothetical protein